jgi:hypothetical protein
LSGDEALISPSPRKVFAANAGAIRLTLAL